MPDNCRAAVTRGLSRYPLSFRSRQPRANRRERKRERRKDEANVHCRAGARNRTFLSMKDADLTAVTFKLDDDKLKRAHNGITFYVNWQTFRDFSRTSDLVESLLSLEPRRGARQDIFGRII